MADTPSTADPSSLDAVVVGGGPAGLMAAEVLAGAGRRVDLFDTMPSVGRKFLLAGKGGLNLTHSEGRDTFLSRYGVRRAAIEPLLDTFGPDALREWVRGLGLDTFIGTSGRVFPSDLKAAPLLRAWLRRLREQGVRFHMRQRWLGFGAGGALRFANAGSEQDVQPSVTVFALGGASWPRLGSDGAWVPLLAERGVDIAPLKAANCGFEVRGGWSALLRERCAGKPVKPVAISHGEGAARVRTQGEFVVTESGVEGSLVYAFSAALRDEIEAKGEATLTLDLLPDRDAAFVLAEVMRPRGSRSLATHLKSRLGIDGVKATLLHEVLGRDRINDAATLAATIKALPLTLVAARPVAEAISTAGGIRFEAMDRALMLTALPGMFCAGEMLDWEAPTGGYLLNASLASGLVAGRGAAAWLAQTAPSR